MQSLSFIDYWRLHSYSEIFGLFIKSIIFSYLTLLCPSVTWSNIMGGGVPDPNIVHIEVRLRPYIIFINNSFLFPLHVQLFCTSPLISKPFALLFPTARDLWGSCPPLRRRRNFKNRSCGNALVHNVVTEVDLISNHPHPRIHQSLANGGGYSHCPVFHQGTRT